MSRRKRISASRHDRCDVRPGGWRRARAANVTMVVIWLLVGAASLYGAGPARGSVDGGTPGAATPQPQAGVVAPTPAATPEGGNPKAIALLQKARAAMTLDPPRIARSAHYMMMTDSDNAEACRSVLTIAET